MTYKYVSTTFWNAVAVIHKYERLGWKAMKHSQPEGSRPFPFNFAMIITFQKAV